MSYVVWFYADSRKSTKVEDYKRKIREWGKNNDTRFEFLCCLYFAIKIRNISLTVNKTVLEKSYKTWAANAGRQHLEGSFSAERALWSEASVILAEAAKHYSCISFPIIWEINLPVEQTKKCICPAMCLWSNDSILKETHHRTMKHHHYKKASSSGSTIN